jgi:hypothetical protein
MQVELTDEEANVVIRALATQETMTPQNTHGVRAIAKKFLDGLSVIEMRMPAWWRPNGRL